MWHEVFVFLSALCIGKLSEPSARLMAEHASLYLQVLWLYVLLPGYIDAQLLRASQLLCESLEHVVTYDHYIALSWRVRYQT